MTTDEKLAVIARAVLEIEQKAVRTWDNDGEDAYGAGLFLTRSFTQKLEEIAALTGEDTSGSPTSQNTEPGLAFFDAGEP